MTASNLDLTSPWIQVCVVGTLIPKELPSLDQWGTISSIHPTSWMLPTLFHSLKRWISDWTVGCMNEWMPPYSDSPPNGGWIQLMSISTTLSMVPPPIGQGPSPPPVFNFILFIIFWEACLRLTLCPLPSSLPQVSTCLVAQPIVEMINSDESFH